MGKLVKKDGKLLKKGGKFVKTDNPANCPCCGGDPCPPGKFCVWTPPDQCATGKCTSYESDDPVECPFPYDCTSEEACNQWYEQNPNPPCDCWFCEDGVWVNKPAYAKDCSEQGGYTGSSPPEGVVCEPPPPVSCGVPVPRTATVNLCGFIDRAFKPPCVGGQAGYAAFFNQTVNLTLKDPVPAEPITWIGELSLPDGWTAHKVYLYRGTESFESCNWAQLQITSSQCVSAIFSRGNSVPLPPFASGWTFGALRTTAPTPDLTLLTPRGIAFDSQSTCRVEFGGTRENPLP
jgi:hypothetical protein